MKLDGRPVEADEMWCKVVATDATLEDVNYDYPDWQKKTVSSVRCVLLEAIKGRSQVERHFHTFFFSMSVILIHCLQ